MEGKKYLTDTLNVIIQKKLLFIKDLKKNYLTKNMLPNKSLLIRGIKYVSKNCDKMKLQRIKAKVIFFISNFVFTI